MIISIDQILLNKITGEYQFSIKTKTNEECIMKINNKLFDQLRSFTCNKKKASQLIILLLFNKFKFKQ